MERADSLYFAVSVIEGIELIKFSKRKKKTAKKSTARKNKLRKIMKSSPRIIKYEWTDEMVTIIFAMSDMKH